MPGRQRILRFAHPSGWALARDMFQQLGNQYTQGKHFCPGLLCASLAFATKGSQYALSGFAGKLRRLSEPCGQDRMQTQSSNSGERLFRELG